MFTSHSKYIKIFFSILAVLGMTLMLLCSCALPGDDANDGAAGEVTSEKKVEEKDEAKYTFTDGVLKSQDGTVYHKYDKDVESYLSMTELGDFLGKVEGVDGKDGYKRKKGIYSANSDGSDDYVIFVGDKTADSGDPSQTLWPIYVKDGCELDICGWDNMTEITLMYVAPGTAADENGLLAFTTYNLKDGSTPADAMKAFIGDEYVDSGKADYSKYFGDIHYKIKGIDMVDISCRTEYKLKSGWVMTFADSSSYLINKEAFGLFEMPADMLDYMQFPLTEDEMIGGIG